MKVIFLCDTSTGSDGSYQNCNAPRSAAMSIKLEYVYGFIRSLCEINNIFVSFMSFNYIGLLNITP